MGGSGELGALVRNFRRRAGRTQVGLAELAGVSIGVVRDVEQGRVRIPRAQTVRALVTGLGLTEMEAARLWSLAGGGGGVRIELLGPLRVWSNGRLVDVGSAAQRAVVGLLGLGLGEVVRAEELAEGVWGSARPESVDGSLRSRVSRVRGLLDNGVRTVPGGGYRLDLDRVAVDITDFREGVRRARQLHAAGDPDGACTEFGTALGLWRGEVLAGLEMTAHPTVAALLAEWQRVIVEYAKAATEIGRHIEVVPVLRRLIAAEPLQESAHAALMVALVGCGQQATAMEVFTDIRRRLAQELGADPGPELRAAQEHLLHHPSKSEVHPAMPSVPPVTVRAYNHLPPDVQDFVGREPQLRQLWRQTTKEDARAVIIHGMPGIGKTRLAVRFAQQRQEAGYDRDLSVYVDLRGNADHPPADPSEVLISVLRLLDVAPEHIPTTLAERAALFRQRLAGRRALILLDNATHEHHLTPLLPQHPDTLVLITSRRAISLDGAHQLHLTELSSSDAQAMLAKHAGTRETHDRAARRIINLCGHHPHAIALAADLLRTRPSWTLPDLAHRLTHTPNPLTELATLHTLFDLSYHDLTPTQQHTLRHLALHPTQEITPESAAALTGLQPDQAHAVLEQLTHHHLLTTITSRRYHLHNLLTHYTQTLVDQHETPIQQHLATTRLLAYYLHTASKAMRVLYPTRWCPEPPFEPPQWTVEFESFEDSYRWLATESAALAEAAKLASKENLVTHAWQLVYASVECAFLDGSTEIWTHVHETAIDATMAAGDRLGELVLRTHLGNLHAVRGNNLAARRQLDRAMELASNDEYPEFARRTMAVCCWLNSRLGRLREAASYAERLAQRPSTDLLTDGIVLTAAGRYLQKLGRPAQAADSLRRAMALFEQAREYNSEPVVLAELGEAYRLLGEYSAAADCFERALANGAGFQWIEMFSTLRLGVTYRALGRHAEAIRHLWQAVRDSQLTLTMISAAESVVDLAIAYGMSGELDTAKHLLRQGLDLATQAGERYEEARAHDRLAWVAESTDDYPTAQVHRKQADELFQELGVLADSYVHTEISPAS
ncbi:DNA-binding SARP family transcriptional activator [Tamaricihabitans halophyticus]|uniref:DNA-binding SARP family transcriptional activator n=1 Tax=Tamaricihabitans halophyticus TaxID=1262583 RepID=A0A4R2QK57_9PSEU|nr:BTAD domain-containing putative transcriptional regulator [Tamaricihabitans halophyticus]TCP47375.1 DNA-binding SARP family transcriptional activator [Tamaricihabitans halophyticus]